jgi:virulence factor
MLKIGIIGLGDIAQKAYLPVIGKKNVEIHLCTRNEDTLRRVGEQYRIKNRHTSLESLINSGITGAFVHAPTAAHENLVEQLLSHNIHVYVDKPITYDYSSSEKLAALADKKKLLLTVGFNRRYAPAYQKLKELRNPNMIIMQKNRRSLPGDVRTFLFDDFIHVIDTILYLFPYPIEKIAVAGKVKEAKLYQVVVQLTSADGAIALGIMNRDSGMVEERLEVFTSGEKRAVRNLADVVIHQDKNETRLGPDDWETTLHRRGFEQIVETFLQALASTSPTLDNRDALLTHKICEQVVAKLMRPGEGQAD